MGPMWPAGLLAGWKSSFHFSKCYFSQTETQNLAMDLANGVPECILDPFSRLLQTILYRTDRRRAHHLPPDPNIFNRHNRFLLNWPFSGGGKILIFPKCYFWQIGGEFGSKPSRATAAFLAGAFFFTQKTTFGDFQVGRSRAGVQSHQL